jgi:PhnB protein
MRGKGMAEKARTTLVPYLIFNGRAAEAMRFYKSILGGELNIRTFGEALIARSPLEKDRVLHSTLKSDYFAFMACDTPVGEEVRCGSNVHIRLSGKDGRKLAAIFKGLSVGGKVTSPLSKQLWRDTYGMVKDKFGVRWMVNIEARPLSGAGK